MEPKTYLEEYDMEIKISKCDTVNKNNILYPLKEMKKCIRAFNKLSQDDCRRNVAFYRAPDPPSNEARLGKIQELKIRDKVVIADFVFGNNEFAQDIKKFYTECIDKGVDPSHFDFRIMMDISANVEHQENYDSASDLEVYQFVFGLDSSWR